jgi:alpha-D-xyloside xylohydrolase
MDYPKDTNTWTLDDEYLVGPSLLVAPIFSGQKTRSVYLPQGEWFDFWTGARVSGGRRIEVEKPLDQIPVYVKNDTLLPMAKPIVCVEPGASFDVTVRAYGSNPAAFTLYEDDGLTYQFDEGIQNRITLKWTPADGGKVEKTGGYTNQPCYKIVDWQGIEGK